MTDHTRALILRVLTHLRHAAAQPTIDPVLVTTLIAPEIQRLESVLTTLDGEHATLAQLIRAATKERHRTADQLRAAQRTLQRIMQILGPTVPTDPGCAGCISEIGAALDELRAYGIRYRDGADADPGDQG